MIFDAAVAEAAYPDRLLRHAAFSNDPGIALAAANAWISSVDVEAVTYPQHRMIARMMMRHDGKLDESPVVLRLRGVRRQLWTRSKINLSLLTPALTAFGDMAGDVMVLGAAAWLARGAPFAADGFDVADLAVRAGRYGEAVAYLTAAGWTIAPVQAESWQRAAILWLSRAPSGRVRLHQPRAFAGMDEVALFDATECGNVAEGLPVTVPELSTTVVIALCQANAGHPVGDQWLFDLGNTAAQPGGREVLQSAFASGDGSGARHLAEWLGAEAGLTAHLPTSPPVVPQGSAAPIR